MCPTLSALHIVTLFLKKFYFLIGELASTFFKALQQDREVGMIIIPILQTRKQRHKQGCLAKSGRARFEPGQFCFL